MDCLGDRIGSTQVFEKACDRGGVSICNFVGWPSVRNLMAQQRGAPGDAATRIRATFGNVEPRLSEASRAPLSLEGEGICTVVQSLALLGDSFRGLKQNCAPSGVVLDCSSLVLRSRHL